MERPLPPPIPKFLFRLVLVSFALQVAMIGIFHQYRTRPQEDHFAFGWEMGRVARSIAQGQGFSNPYGGSTGPTRLRSRDSVPSDGGSLQALRYLHVCLGMGSAKHQQPLCRAHENSDLSDRAENIRRTCRALVSMGMGVESLHLVLVDPLEWDTTIRRCGLFGRT